MKKNKMSEKEAATTATQLLKLSSAINFLADELGELGEVKTTSVKIHDVSFERVLKQKKNDVVAALLTFDRIARDPEKAEEILKK